MLLLSIAGAKNAPVEGSDLSLILRSLGLDPKEFLEDNEFHLLEAEHPALCADRID